MNYIMTNSGTISAVVDNCAYTADTSHPNYNDLLEAIREDDEESFLTLIDIPKTIEKFCEGDVEVKDGVVYYSGEPLRNSLTERIVKLIEQEMPYAPMLNFLNNLMKNPANSSVESLFDFLDKQNPPLPITEDGCFLAYKRVKDDWTDFHTGKEDNSIGAAPAMPRNKVDDNRGNDCSHGYHVGSIAYVRDFHKGEGHIIICKVNPANAVSVPTHDANKLRVCAYEVVSEYDGLMEDVLYTNDGKVWQHADNSYTDDDDCADCSGCDCNDEDDDCCSGCGMLFEECECD
jgi:hypothetical protein